MIYVSSHIAAKHLREKNKHMAECEDIMERTIESADRMYKKLEKALYEDKPYKKRYFTKYGRSWLIGHFSGVDYIREEIHDYLMEQIYLYLLFIFFGFSILGIVIFFIRL